MNSNLIRLKPFDQNCQQLQNLATKYHTTNGICGFIVCALCQYFLSLQANSEEWNPALFQAITVQKIIPYVQNAIKCILAKRRMQLKKFMNKMPQQDKVGYMKNYVANYEIEDYLRQLLKKDNKNGIKQNIVFARHCSYDFIMKGHQKLSVQQVQQNIKYQQGQRIKDQTAFIGQKYFFTSFQKQLEHHHFEYLVQKFKNNKINQQNSESYKPFILVIDTSDHYNIMVCLKDQNYLIDTLTIINEGNFFDQKIIEAILYSRKQANLNQI